GVRHRRFPLERASRVGAADAARRPHPGPRVRLARGRRARAERIATADLRRAEPAMNPPAGPAPADFLDRLVGKARGEDGGLRPRPPSLFEPTRHVRLDTATDLELSELVEERIAETRRPARGEDGSTIAPVVIA